MHQAYFCIKLASRCSKLLMHQAYFCIKINCFFVYYSWGVTDGGYKFTQISLKKINRRLRDQQEQPPSDTAIRKQWHLIGFYKLSGLLRLPIDYYFLPQAKLHPSDWRSEASWKHLCYWLNLDRYKCLYVYVEGERKLTTEMTDRYNEAVGEILKR